MPVSDYRSLLYESYVKSHVELSQDVSLDSLRKQQVVYRKILKNLIPSNKEAEILDAGCGHGGLVHFLNSEGYKHVTGVDFSAEQAALGRRLGIPNVYQENMFSFLERKRSCFDLIIAFDVLEHLKKEEIVNFLELAYQGLKPGGAFVVRVPNGTSPFSGYYRYGDFTHETAFTPESIRQVLNGARFAGIRIFPAKPVVHGPASALRHLLWEGIETLMRFLLFVETGEFRGKIFTQNLIASAARTG